MRNYGFFILISLFAVVLFLRVSYVQDYARWGLPEGAKARLGKGYVTGDIAYSPDSAHIAVASSIGIWLYDVGTGDEVNLLTGHTRPVHSVAFSPDGWTLASRASSFPALDTHTHQFKAGGDSCSYHNCLISVPTCLRCGARPDQSQLTRKWRRV